MTTHDVTPRDSAPPRLIVSELFGPTFQGEGPSQGRRSMFLRLGGCNLACTWCDTPYTWDATRFNLRAEMRPMSHLNILERLYAADPSCRRLVITGGEPTLQARGLRPLLTILRDRQWWVEVETNGTRLPPYGPGHYVDQWNVSFKPPSAENSTRTVDPDAAQAWANTLFAIFKFVVAGGADWDFTQETVNRLGISPERVWVMPEGTAAPTITDRLVWLAPRALHAGYNLSDRLHVRLWGNQRGR